MYDIVNVMKHIGKKKDKEGFNVESVEYLSYLC
jgi:hypothetical protein